MTLTRQQMKADLARVDAVLRESRRRQDIFERATDCSHAYDEVHQHIVSSLVCTAATAARRLSCIYLDIPRLPVIRWFVPNTTTGRAAFQGPPNLLGLADRESWTVWIRAGRDVGETIKTVAHETFHLGQRDPNAVDAPLDRWERNERDARRFEDIFLANFSRVFDTRVGDPAVTAPHPGRTGPGTLPSRNGEPRAYMARLRGAAAPPRSEAAA